MAVKGLAAGPEVRVEAGRLHVSPGRLALYLAARQVGIEVTLEQLREGPVGQVLRQAWGRQAKKGTPDQQVEDSRSGTVAPPGEKAPPPGPGGTAIKPGEKTPPSGPSGTVTAPGEKTPLPGGSMTVPGGEKGPDGGHRPAGTPGRTVPGGTVGQGSQVPGAEPGEGEQEIVAWPELLEKLWEKAGVEKELPGLMKKFLPTPDRDRESHREKGKSGGR